MCGINIIIDKNSRLDQKSIGQMMAAIQHRGPDASNFYKIRSTNQTAWIASNRLKISDLRNEANQPMCTENNRYTLAFNGAIYNDRALRHHLGDVNFQTSSDTETILQLLVQRNSHALTELNGMFALAFYDQATETLLVARDQWGMKPVYWFESDSCLIISSEIRGILASGLVSKEPDLSQIPHYLTFKFAQRPATFYKHIQEIEPGCMGVSTPKNQLALRTFDTLRRQVNRPRGAGFDNLKDTILTASAAPHAITRLESALTDVVSHYCQADVPAGLFLSGGVDSTLLLACAYEKGIRSLPVFTIGYSGSDRQYVTQDQLFAQRAASQYKAELHQITLNPSLLERFPEWVQTLDQPVADGAAWLTYLLAQEARKYVKIVLSGAGADELFAGYNRHWAFGQYLTYYSLLKNFIPDSKNSISQKAKSQGLISPTSYYGRLFRKGLGLLNRSPARTFTRFTAATTAFDMANELALAENYFPDNQSHLTPFRESHLAAALAFDQSRYLISDVLTITDRMTMQHGIEARLPYLDNTVATIANSLPAEYLLKHGQKWLLKKILSDKKGKPYTRRRKEGFGMPIGHWLRTPAASGMLVSLQKSSNLIYNVVHYSFVQDLLHGHLNKRADYTNEIWALALLAAWLEKEF